MLLEHVLCGEAPTSFVLLDMDSKGRQDFGKFIKEIAFNVDLQSDT